MSTSPCMLAPCSLEGRGYDIIALSEIVMRWRTVEVESKGGVLGLHTLNWLPRTLSSPHLMQVECNTRSGTNPTGSPASPSTSYKGPNARNDPALHGFPPEVVSVVTPKV